MASILRTGKLLRYFAGFTRNVVVNSVRDCESNNLLQSAPCMCGQFQNGFASNAAANKAEVTLDRQIRRLDQDARRMGRISRRDLEEVLDEIRTQRTATSSQSLLVIRCCGNLVPEELPEVRTALVQEIWKTLNALNVPMDISHYNALLRVYLENEHQFAPTDFLAEIEAKGIEPNRVTYQRLIARYCQQGDIEGATRILEYMRGKSLPVNENVFNSLILGHSEANDLESAKGILGVMKQAGLEPSADTYTTLLCAFARHGDIEALHALLAECETKDIILLDKDLLDIVYTLTVNGHGEQVDTLLGKMRISPGFNQDAVNVILRLVNKGHEDVALKLLRLMPRSTRINGEAVDVGAFFIRQLVKANRPVEKILSICRTLQSEGLNPKALTIATEAGLTNGAINNALPLLQEMKNLGLPIRQHYFWPLFCSVESSQVLEIVRRMQQEFALHPNSETVRDYVIPNLKEKNWERIVTVLRDAGVPNSTAVTSAVYAALITHQIADAAKIMEQNRTYYMPILFRQPLILALSNTNDFASFIRCVRQLHEGLQLRINKETAEETEAVASDVEATAATTPERTTPDVVGSIVYEAAIYFRRERVPMLEKILLGLVKQGLSVSSAKATALSELLGSEMTPKISEQLGKLSSGELEPIPLPNSGKRGLDTLSIDELERFIKNIEAKGESANNVKRQLLTACFRSQNLEKTLQVIERFEQDKFQVSLGIYAQLVDLYTFHKRSEDALAQYNKLRKQDASFKLDNFKVVRLVELLLQEERVEDALQLFKENAKEALFNEGEGSFNYLSTVWRLLNAIAETGNAEKLQRIFDALVAGNYIVPNNVLLGPLIKVHLTRDDIPKAIEAFEQICQQHKATPWKNELACRLIQKEDAANLQRLTDLSTSIHGEVNSLYDLVFSFVECGRVRQARKILETPGLRTRPQRISSACDRYKNEGKLQPLEGLIEATKDLGHIDRNKIYYTLLLSYDKADEAEKALGLWTKMQEEAVAPTDAFLLKLGELLKRKDMDVPFVLPETQPQAKIKRAKPVKTEQDKQEIKQESKQESKAESKQEPKQPVVAAAKPTSNTAGFRRAIQSNDPDAAIGFRERFISGEKTSVLDTSRLIELLVRGDRLVEASKYVDELLGDKQHPQPKIFKYYLNKIAASGDLERLQAIGTKLNDEQKRLVSFDNRYCHAYIVAGKAEQFIKQLSTEIEAAKTPEEAAKLAEKFPRGGAVGILDKHPELVAQYESLAEKYAALNQLGPMNVLWMHLISSGQEAASKQIWDKHLSSAPRLMFQRVLQTAREQQDEKLAATVISQLRDSKISEGAIGNAYSCLLDIQTSKGNTDKALEVLANAIKDVSLENINRTALLRLKQAVEEKSQKFPYTVPEKRTKADESSSSSSSSSSDDDVAPKRPETVPAKPEHL